MKHFLNVFSFLILISSLYLYNFLNNLKQHKAEVLSETTSSVPTPTSSPKVSE